MKIEKSNSNPYNSINNVNFASRKLSVRKADDICRRVVLEFPTISNTKIERYKGAKTYPLYSYNDFANDAIASGRYYSHLATSYADHIFYELNIMKEHKLGNCGEFSTASLLALRLNGYQNVKQLSVYAYNKETHCIRDLDHSVVGINVDIPKSSLQKTLFSVPTYKDKITPNKDTIIFDSWSGFADSYSGAVRRFKDNNLIDKLRENETICFIQDENNYIPEKDLPMYKKMFPSLILPENKNLIDEKVQTHRSNDYGELIKDDLQNLRGKYNIHPTNNEHIKPLSEPNFDIYSNKEDSKVVSIFKTILEAIKASFL